MASKKKRAGKTGESPHRPAKSQGHGSEKGPEKISAPHEVSAIQTGDLKRALAQVGRPGIALSARELLVLRRIYARGGQEYVAPIKSERQQAFSLAKKGLLRQIRPRKPGGAPRYRVTITVANVLARPNIMVSGKTSPGSGKRGAHARASGLGGNTNTDPPDE